MMVIGGLLGAIFAAFGLNIAVKFLIVWVVAMGSMLWFIQPNPSFRAAATHGSIVAAAGTLAFQLAMWIIGGLWGLLIGFILFWVVVSVLLDRYYDIHYDQSYAYTGQIVGVSMLLWVIVSVCIGLLG